MEQRDVVPRPDGNWQIVNPARGRISVIVPTRDDAVQRATRALRSAGGGELRVYEEDGREPVARNVDPTELVRES